VDITPTICINIIYFSSYHLIMEGIFTLIRDGLGGHFLGWKPVDSPCPNLAWRYTRGKFFVPFGRHTAQLFCKLALFGFFLHNYASASFISKNRPLARRRHHWRRACVCRRQYFWRAYVRCRRDLESTWQIPRRHRSWRRSRRPVKDAYLGAKIYGAEVPAYK
jgi:hypothetical protein